ncbi:MAG: hypothetical protein ABSC54_04240 [Smithellaceae bacterium]|jgi:undecaprenyl pyrophosphate phosphatase UppP
MSKVGDFINSKTDDNTLYLINIGTSLATGVLVFFILVPMLFALVEKALHLSYKNNSTLTNTSHFILYYSLSITAVILAIKWQKKKLANKSVKFKKIYSLIVAAIFLLLILFQHLW